MNRKHSAPFSDDVELATLWRAVVDRKLLLAGLVTCAGLLSYIALHFVTPIYTSQALILIEYNEPTFTKPRTDSGNANRRTLVDPEAVTSQVQVLFSRDLARQVVTDLRLEDDSEFNTESGTLAPFKKILIAMGFSHASRYPAQGSNRTLDLFKQRLRVTQVKKSRVITVEFSSSNAKTAADVATRLAEVYLTWQRREKLDQTRDASQWLNMQIKTLHKQVETSEAGVEEFRSASGLIPGSNDVALDAQQLSGVNRQLTVAKAQRTEAEARANLIKRMLREKGDVASAADVMRSALIQRLLEQRVRVRRQRAELSAILLPSHPRIRQLNSELAVLNTQIRKAAMEVVDGLQNEAQLAGTREASLRASLNRLKKESSASREDQIKLRSLERETKAKKDLLESYLARHREASARSDETSLPVHASIISTAHIERKPSFPRKKLISALAATAVGLVSLAWVLACELVGHTRKISSARSFASSAAPPGNTTSAQPVPSQAPDRSGQRFHARSARDAAGIVTPKCSGPTAHTLIVTADNHHAETAADALDVSRMLASSGLHVAIVDFSDSGSNVAGLAGLADTPGVAELLSGSARFEDVVNADTASTLQIIPPGARQRNILAGDGTPQWCRVHNALRQIYDCIVLHTSLSCASPLLAVMQHDAATLLLVTDKKGDAVFGGEISDLLSGATAASIDIVACESARAGMELQELLRSDGIPLRKDGKHPALQPA